MAYVTLSIRILICLVFGVAAAAKAADLGGFASSVRRLVPESRGRAGSLAGAVVAAECAVAIAAAVPGTSGAVLGFGGALAMDAGFCFVLVRDLKAGGTREACRCFGQWSADTLSPVQLGRNAVIGLLCVLGLIAAPASRSALHAQGVMIAAFCGVLGAVLVIAFEDLTALARSIPSTT